MALFPSWWELLLPNWSWWTFAGVVLLVFAVIAFKASSWLNLEISRKIAFANLATGLFLIWGVSIIQDFVNSDAGLLITLGSVVVAFFGLVLFWKPKKASRRKKK